MDAIGVSKAPYFFSTRCCICLRVRVSRGRNRCEAFRSKTPTGGAAFSRLLVLVPIVSCSKDLDLFLVLVPSAACLFKSLDKSCLGPLRKAYCSSLNLLLRHEAREFANELRAITKASRNPTVLLEDTSTASIYFLHIVPFFSHFMCFGVSALAQPGSPANGNKTHEDDLGIMEIDDNDDDDNNNNKRLITCMTQGTTSLLSNTVYGISEAATQDQVPENGVKGISKDKPLYAFDQWEALLSLKKSGKIDELLLQDPPRAGKTQTILGLLSAILQTSWVTILLK
ncbi:unnamed protein product [Lactuca saligna]|uniref:Uncharacterized protein n=1 Tax=Lactuca saligna TaxID=75948 RepID=A0AA35ZF57_LACSI|nr:unnamed protein product [Lactuca saligna]